MKNAEQYRALVMIQTWLICNQIIESISDQSWEICNSMFHEEGMAENTASIGHARLGKVYFLDSLVEFLSVPSGGSHQESLIF